MLPGVAASFNMVAHGLVKEVAGLFLTAFQADPQRPGEHQAEHLHEALAIHPVLAIVQGYRIGLGSGYSYKILHIPDRAEMYDKFLAIFHLALYKPFCFVYNGEESRNSPLTQLYQIM